MIIILFILFIIITFVYVFMLITSKDNNKEHYRDIIPIKLLNNIFNCYNKKCILDNGFTCRQYCNKIDELGAKENCKMSCEDFSDIMFHYNRYDNAIFGSSLNKLKKYSLLNDDI